MLAPLTAPMTAMPLDLEQRLNAAPSEAEAKPKPEWDKLLNWLLIWVVLTNIAFLPMWLIGSPPRHEPILAAGVIGLIVRRAPAWAQFIAFLAVLTYSVLSFVAAVFNLAIGSLLYSLRFMMEIQPAQSLEYVFGACMIVVVVIAGWFAVRRDSAFIDWRPTLVAVLATLALAGLDLWMGQGMRGHYKQAASADAPFESAMMATGAEQNAIANNRNLAIIMVESMGVPVDNAEMERLLFSGLDTPMMRERFTSSRGTSLYYNSTTAAEVRELCGRWGDYYEIVDAGGDPSCLPARMKNAGYETHALHSFAGFFFARETWYPGIGFETSRFADELTDAGAQVCGGVFPGACDRDVPAQLAEQLKSTDKPQLVYWLTVNSHLPVPSGVNLEVDNCEQLSPELARDYPMICRQFSLWDQLEKALVAEIGKPDFPPTDFLILGDHMPPYFDRRLREQFAPDRVPYLYLQWRDDFAAEPTDG